MNKAKTFLGLGLLLRMAFSGCMPKKYWVVSYACPNGRGPGLIPSPVIVVRDSIKGQVRLKPGGLQVKKSIVKTERTLG